MINIITQRDLIAGYKYIFNNFDAFVHAFVTANDFSELDELALKKIDNAYIVEKSTDLVKTKYGITTIENLSSGCKTVLTYLYYRRNLEKYSDSVIFDVNECGWNALEVLFEIADKLNDNQTRFYLCHENDIYKCKERQYLINEQKVISDLLYI